MSWFSPQCVGQDGSCHKDTSGEASQMLLSAGPPTFLGLPCHYSYTSINRDGKSYRRTSYIPAWVIQLPTPSEPCFLLLSIPSLCRIPVLPITKEIHWLSSCLISFLSVNRHIGRTYFSFFFCIPSLSSSKRKVFRTESCHSVAIDRDECSVSHWAEVPRCRSSFPVEKISFLLLLLRNEYLW